MTLSHYEYIKTEFSFHVNTWKELNIDMCIVLLYIIAILPQSEVLMPDESKNTSSQFNTRLPLLTHEQISQITKDYGLTKTQVIIMAVDRLARDLSAESAEAQKDIRMRKTVAGISPQLDLGQEA